MSTQQSSSTSQYESLAFYYAQVGVRPRQSVNSLSSSEPLSASVNVVTASSGMQSFSTGTPAPSFLPYRLPTSGQANSDSLSQRSSFQNCSSRVMCKTLIYLVA